MAEKMKTKHDKYCKNLDDINLMLFIAIIHDPRTKLDAFDFLFVEVLNIKQATHMVTKLRHHIVKLYD
jgi:hypothetical protein